MLLWHPELAAEAEEITSALLVVENDQELADEITARLRALRPNGPVSVDTGRGRVLDVLQPYIDNLTRRKNAASGGRPPASRSPSCSGCTNAKPLHLWLPSLADKCPEWEWYEER